MKQKNILLHMIACTINQIYKTQKDAHDILSSETLKEKEKLALLQGENGIDYRLFNYIIALQPALEIAKKEFTGNPEFFEWIEEKWALMNEKKWISDACHCAGCTIQDDEKPKDPS